ncbi:MAG: DUF3127 domain-containing protein [Candidatus Amulumruptor caecigallinarius]|nr:DUF3127 domain-containing protein [Candidatus Amulumruptor caecigallinarius]MCM1396885.1 DUF3127 domain-containing protein [Candidatus Amulumruptor caecigallinarius]MCM1454171.1 DUF3127 domain-containing protein [bacterium]
MEIQGKIIFALPEVTGTSKATGNPWKKREYVLETHDQFPKKVHFDFFGDRADQYPLNVGDEITLSFDIESREYNGRWYTSIRGWKAEKAGAAQSMPQGNQGYGMPAPPPAGPATGFPGGYGAPAAPADLTPGADSSSDLPF